MTTRRLVRLVVVIGVLAGLIATLAALISSSGSGAEAPALGGRAAWHQPHAGRVHPGRGATRRPRPRVRAHDRFVPRRHHPRELVEQLAAGDAVSGGGTSLSRLEAGFLDRSLRRAGARTAAVRPVEGWPGGVLDRAATPARPLVGGRVRAGRDLRADRVTRRHPRRARLQPRRPRLRQRRSAARPQLDPPAAGGARRAVRGADRLRADRRLALSATAPRFCGAA